MIMINLHLVEKQSRQTCPLSSPAALQSAQHFSWQIMHLWDVVRQVTQGMELNETFFVVFLGPDLMGVGDGATPAAALGLLHFLEAEAPLVLLLLLLLLFLAASADSLVSRISIHPLLCMW